MVKTKLKLANLITTYDLKKELNLNKLYENLDGFIYDIETSNFPAGFYNLEGVNFTVFRTGKLVLKGKRNLEEMELILRKFKKQLRACGFLN